MDEIRCAISLELDELRSGPGRIVGQLIPYGQRAKDRPELFESGALSWPERGIVLNRQHDRASPILRFIPRASASELRIEAPLPDTQAGRDAAEEIRSGLFQGLSIEFRAVRERVSGGVRRISEAILRGAALVDSPSYPTGVEIRKRRADSWVY